MIDKKIIKKNDIVIFKNNYPPTDNKVYNKELLIAAIQNKAINIVNYLLEDYKGENKYQITLSPDIVKAMVKTKTDIFIKMLVEMFENKQKDSARIAIMFAVNDALKYENLSVLSYLMTNYAKFSTVSLDKDFLIKIKNEEILNYFLYDYKIDTSKYTKSSEIQKKLEDKNYIVFKKAVKIEPPRLPFEIKNICNDNLNDFLSTFSPEKFSDLHMEIFYLVIKHKAYKIFNYLIEDNISGSKQYNIHLKDEIVPSLIKDINLLKIIVNTNIKYEKKMVILGLKILYKAITVANSVPVIDYMLKSSYFESLKNTIEKDKSFLKKIKKVNVLDYFIYDYGLNKENFILTPQIQEKFNNIALVHKNRLINDLDIVLPIKNKKKI